jgi:hypothetical protein
MKLHLQGDVIDALDTQNIWYRSQVSFEAHFLIRLFIYFFVNFKFCVLCSL